jgi:hypothetical protein
MVGRIAATENTSRSPVGAKMAGFLLFHFTTWAKARAMQHCLGASGQATMQWASPGATGCLDGGRSAPHRRRQSLQVSAVPEHPPEDSHTLPEVSATDPFWHRQSPITEGKPLKWRAESWHQGITRSGGPLQIL